MCLANAPKLTQAFAAMAHNQAHPNDKIPVFANRAARLAAGQGTIGPSPSYRGQT